MYIIGFIKTEEPRALINPVPCRTEKELYKWLINFFSEENFSLDKMITEKNVSQALKSNKPIMIPITGFKVALLFGEDGIIQNSTDRFIHTDLFNYSDYMAN